MSRIEEGKKAPDFTLDDQDGKPVTLSSFKGRDVLVYFYPKDDTPGCTKEACGFRDFWKDLQKAGAVGEYCGGVVIRKGKGIEWLSKGDEKDAIRKPLAWNSMRVLAKGAHLEVDLNGVKIVDVTDPEPPARNLQAGVIALQTYGAEGHAGYVKFRNLKIRTL